MPAASRPSHSQIYLDAPAAGYSHSLPVGNGRLGALLPGGVAEEQIVLCEDTIWQRAAENPANPSAREALPRVRALLMAGQPEQAMQLAEACLMGSPNRISPFQPLGRLRLRFAGHAGGLPRDYAHCLDLADAVATCAYEMGGVRFKRAAFASMPDQVFALRITASQPVIDCVLTLDRDADARTSAAGSDQLQMEGQAGSNGTRFTARLQVLCDDGQCVAHGDRLHVTDCSAFTILLAAGTDYRGDDPTATAEAELREAAGKPYDQLLADHVAAHRKQFSRVAIDLAGTDPDVAALPTPQRLERVRAGQTDADLLRLYFDFGRYLLISSSQPGTLPANLQGIWVWEMAPPWNCDFHININLQMNYWPAGVCDLDDCHRPLFDWMAEQLVPSGEKTAEDHYGCGGWVAHHISNAWGWSAPSDAASCGLWPTGGAWLCDHLWEHFLFTGDEAFLLETALPILRGACEFFLEFLVEDDSGQLLCGPSSSPENHYLLPDGTRGALCMGATMDNQILRELFTHTLEAVRVLKLEAAEAELVAQLEAALPKLPPNQVGKHGQIMEWPDDYDEAEPGHRHVSPLFGLHPTWQISPDQTPELAEAAATTLTRRLEHGGAHTGWSAAWLVSMYARLHDGERAHGMLLKLLRQSTLPNLFDTHPPFQIDGNFGGCAGITEMLIQSQPGVIRLLPALPKAWPDGNFRGLRARGGVSVDATWRDGRLISATLRADRDGELAIRLPAGHRLTRATQRGETLDMREDNGGVRLALNAASPCELTFDYTDESVGGGGI